MKVEVDKDLLDFAVNHIWMEVAIKHGVYHDQPTLIEDMDRLVTDGMLPCGWYDLKKLLDEANSVGNSSTEVL